MSTASQHDPAKIPRRATPRRRPLRLARALLIVSCLSTPAGAEEALVAVATNFAETIERLETDFERATEHRLTVVSGSTGKLYAQVRHGAPFDLLLAADQERPRRLEREGLVVPEGRATYAIGRLVLWSRDPEAMAEDGPATLARAEFRRLAIANPELAPYGAAALEALGSLGLLERLTPRLVRGENVGQAFAMVATGNAELGFVALAQLGSARHDGSGSLWEVPETLHAPIRQDVVLLARAAGNEAARDFLSYLRSPAARRVIRDFGYRVD